MKSGHINQYAHLSQFQTVQHFNETIEHYLVKYGDQLTKGERLSFQILTRFSVKEIGICNARICKLVEAAQTEKGGISRSTFIRKWGYAGFLAQKSLPLKWNVHFLKFV